MRSICSIIALIYFFNVIGTERELAEEEESGSLVWYDGINYYKELNTRKGQTLYFSKWNKSIELFLQDSDYKVVLQLDRTLNPQPDKKNDIPNLLSLSAISSKELVVEYLQFLENLGRSIGYVHLVLPDTTGLSRYEKEVIYLANTQSPYYFISKTTLSDAPPTSKKGFQTETPKIYISQQTSKSNKLVKWSKKIARQHYRSFYNGLLEAESADFSKTDLLSKELSHAIFESSAVAVNNQNLLPLKSEGLIYLGENDELRHMLSRYVRVFSKPQPELYPVIIDKRTPYEGKIFGNEIVIDYLSLSAIEQAEALLVSGNHENDAVEIAKMLFGATAVPGRIDVQGHHPLKASGAIGYSYPELEGLDANYLGKINEFVSEAIQKLATPGCQLTVVKNGSIVLEESYGFFTYDSLKALANQDMYDLASITKVAATLPAVALLVDQGKINLEDSLGQHLPDFIDSNKSHITIKQLLGHNGGIRSYIPFWRRAMDGDRLDVFYYKTKEDEANDRRTYGLEPHPNLKDTLQSWIQQSELIKHPEKYNYSDLGFMILHLLVEEVSGQPFDLFMNQNFYEPMNLKMAFNPKKRGYSLTNIVPTEYDERYRNDLVWGEVHDRNAHAFGGVAGHAGLFSNATDLAKLMFMFSNDGYFNGRQYLSKETLDSFNYRYFKNNRRGLAWDKKDWNRDAASSKASDKSFGHTGFTGTMVWSDPDNDLIFVFLSNRIYPDANNSKLMELNTRTEIHDVIYKSILND